MVKRSDRLRVALEMREKGKTLMVIGKHLGVSHVAVSKMLSNEKRRIKMELEDARTARVRKSERRFDVIRETEGLVRLHIKAAKDDPTDKGTGGMAYTGIRLLAQLRGELIEKRDTKTRVGPVETWTDEDEAEAQRIAEELGLGGNGNDNESSS